MSFETVNTFLFWFAMFWLCVSAWIVVFHRGIPNVRSTPAIRRRAIELIRDDMAARKLAAYTIADLGSGNGVFTREIASALPEAQVLGLEISPYSVMLSEMARKRRRLGNLSYRRANFLDVDFSKVDAVVMYLLPNILTTVGKKLLAETRPGTLILTNRFALGGGWQPVETLEVETGHINQRQLFVYRKA